MKDCRGRDCRLGTECFKLQPDAVECTCGFKNPSGLRIRELESELADVKKERDEYIQELCAEQAECVKQHTLCDQLRARLALFEKLREAAEFSKGTIEHALFLGHCGEGSTMRMANDAVRKLEQALAPLDAIDEE